MLTDNVLGNVTMRYVEYYRPKNSPQKNAENVLVVKLVFLYLCKMFIFTRSTSSLSKKSKPETL